MHLPPPPSYDEVCGRHFNGPQVYFSPNNAHGSNISTQQSYAAPRIAWTNTRPVNTIAPGK